jgi:phage terminase large subunit-like protein
MRVSAGFDGSRSEDWTAIRLETADGYRFTPTYGPDSRPTIWNPAEWPGGRIPRGEVKTAVAEVFARYKVARFYVDPRHWETQADEWATEYGEDVVVQWPTNQIDRMFDALVRFLEDTVELATTHDDDPVAKTHALNARKVGKPGDKYILGKPSENQKIDVLMADVLAHEAAADQRAAGWQEVKRTVVVHRRR